MPASTIDRSRSGSSSSGSPSDISRREWLVGAGAGAAALMLEATRGRGAAGLEPDGRVLQHHRAEPGRRAEQRGARGPGRPDRGHRSHRSDPEGVSAGRRLRWARQGPCPRPHQLPRASRADAGTRLQRRFRVPQQLSTRGAAHEPALERRSDADGRRRSAGGHPHRQHHRRRERLGHRPDRRGPGGDRTPLGVRGVGHRPGGRVADVSGGAGEGRGTQVLGEDARRGATAHQRAVHRVAWQGGWAHQRVPGRRAGRELVARAACRCARLRREARPRVHASICPRAAPRSRTCGGTTG